MGSNLPNICQKHFENLEKRTRKLNDLRQLLRIYYGNITIMIASAKRYNTFFVNHTKWLISEKRIAIYSCSKCLDWAWRMGWNWKSRKSTYLHSSILPSQDSFHPLDASKPVYVIFLTDFQNDRMQSLGALIGLKLDLKRSVGSLLTVGFSYSEIPFCKTSPLENVKSEIKRITTKFKSVIDKQSSTVSLIFQSRVQLVIK